MANVGVDVFVRWMRRHGVTNNRARTCFTVAKLVCDGETLYRLLDEVPACLPDESLVEELLSLADPRETVEMLSSRIGPNISPEMFRGVFERTLAASSDIEVLSVLMFEAGMYLDRHPGAFVLPRDLAEQLLNSDDLDHRLAGLKALHHGVASPAEIVAHVTRALKREDREDRWAGLSQLTYLLEEQGPRLAEAVEREALDELRKVLAQMMDTATDANVRPMAARCGALLQAGGEE